MHFLITLFSAKVIGVLDRETIEVLKDKRPLRIRLYGIDSPEHDQDFGTKARRFTAGKVFGKPLRLSPSRRTDTRDR